MNEVQLGIEHEWRLIEKCWQDIERSQNRTFYKFQGVMLVTNMIMCGTALSLVIWDVVTSRTVSVNDVFNVSLLIMLTITMYLIGASYIKRRFWRWTDRRVRRVVRGDRERVTEAMELQRASIARALDYEEQLFQQVNRGRTNVQPGADQ